MSIKIGVISDTHIPDKAEGIPQEILEAFKNMDMVIHCGDLVEEKVLAELKSVCKNVVAVYGNMDPYSLKEKLPEEEILKFKSHSIGITHGYGSPQGLIELLKKKFIGKKVDAIVFGHSHAPFNEKIGGILFFNPGSATDKMFSPYNSYGILEVNDKIKARIIKING